MTALDFLRLANVVLWIGVMTYMATGAWAAARGKGVRRGDPMRLACFITGLIFTLGYGRWLFAPGSEVTWMAVHIMSLLDAAFIIALGRSYGRGEHV